MISALLANLSRFCLDILALTLTVVNDSKGQNGSLLRTFFIVFCSKHSQTRPHSPPHIELHFPRAAHVRAAEVETTPICANVHVAH